jgi:hypothetical protein
LPCLLYCVALSATNPAPNLTGIAEQPVLTLEANGLRVYWSEVASPEALAEGASRKMAEARHRQVLRDIVAAITPLSFPFPAVVESTDAIAALLADQHAAYLEALTRLAGLVQYELTASWAEEEGVDLSKPVSGSEYLKRRQQAEVRVSAIDNKLRTVTAGIVHDWRMRQERRNRIWVVLLARDDRERFIAALRSAGPSEGVRLRLSGPWPPDAFA